ncbi:MAG: DNA-directed RNA polymerase subunit omega [Planctomycetaceae bacterium]|jgi:DNA-directed RNA polymerase subunit omega|nr:DNA-directed RNA polymerase subunit omega [Planctomycetaceae bacterium]MBT4011137.1 DNA-directed RNA polymerase subunit omega [Planctomycetaceae bacterium]MBT4725078.1 DNA-directed RNA polymerase subunit omega [Planctomycetaceae bacterium]MBT4843865.1 DNA-directed RNA polymerase subunit omega [Planctomycetaceae bacterium]MBT5124070.1 DNA-directed RNA polymerase subunit omega [Planctomycetaceae bacterium]
MLEELKEEAIVEKVGGRFKLSTLIQKRIVQLKQGSRPLVDMPADNLMELVLQEILQDKITLDTDNQVYTAEGETPVTDVPDINPLEL